MHTAEDTAQKTSKEAIMTYPEVKSTVPKCVLWSFFFFRFVLIYRLSGDFVLSLLTCEVKV